MPRQRNSNRTKRSGQTRPSWTASHFGAGRDTRTRGVEATGFDKPSAAQESAQARVGCQPSPERCRRVLAEPAVGSHLRERSGPNLWRGSERRRNRVSVATAECRLDALPHAVAIKHARIRSTVAGPPNPSPASSACPHVAASRRATSQRTAPPAKLPALLRERFRRSRASHVLPGARRASEHVARTHIQMETDESSTGHAGVDWEAGATIWRGVQVESWLTGSRRRNRLRDPDLPRRPGGCGRRARPHSLAPTRHFEEPKVDVSRRAG